MACCGRQSYGGVAELGHGGPAQVLASGGHHVMMRCDRNDGEDSLHQSAHVVAEIAEEEPPLLLTALVRLHRGCPLHAPVDVEEKPHGHQGGARQQRPRGPAHCP
ncbi:Os07g0448950 [Oryza sativa Japonica Group]|uniref:Os07g0448950 protein n=1 Tax=Oryza sativa subsp. japonica TaxID=39947 RepID=A0A0P0X5F1_ORYSJ|nr:Os07g0448950 [Oryza sativa Japonica Group]